MLLNNTTYWPVAKFLYNRVGIPILSGVKKIELRMMKKLKVGGGTTRTSLFANSWLVQVKLKYFAMAHVCRPKPLSIINEMNYFVFLWMV